MSKKERKPRPQPPRWVWFELDGCWFCKHQNGCSGCKVIKSYVAEQKRKQNRKNKNDIKHSY